MRAITLENGQLAFRSDYSPRRTPLPGQIPIRVELAGVCETDLQLVKGYMGFEGVLGHEFVGIAEGGRYSGQRVVGEINCSCHHCETCLTGRPSHCPNRTVLGILNHDGAFADRVWLPPENLHRVPDTLSNEQAVFVEPLAAAYQIPAQLDLRLFPRSIILGDGRLGILCAQVLQSSGSSVTLVGKHQWKLDIVRQMKIDTVLLSDVLPERQADLVVDCTGSASGLPLACRLVRPRGTIVLKTTVADPVGPNLAPIVIDEITLVGSRCGPFPEAIRALSERQIDVAPLLTARYPIERATEAFAAAGDGKHLKVLIDLCPSC